LDNSNSKAFVELDLNAKILDTWPLNVHDVPTWVKIGYVLDESVTIKYVHFMYLNIFSF
jgi:hypothetical protein